MILRRLFLSISLLFCCAALSAEETLDYVFKSGDKGYHTYRIPAIVASKKGTLLAFAEGRVNHSGDHGNLDIVLKRSTDGGKTWSDLILVQDDGNNQCGNPAPVVDLRNGRIILLSNGSDKSEGAVMKGEGTRECYVQYSDDDGLTWSPRRNISEQVRPEGWRWYAMGPCSGTQIREGKHKGRLVVAANHSEKEGTYRSHSLYSDDGGRTWKVGAVAGPGSNESQIAEVAPNLLVQNMRMQTHGKGQRAIRTSNDGGQTWKDLRHEPQLPCPRCQGSVIRDYYNGTGHLFFSNPAASPLARKEMTIRASVDGGKTWPLKKVVYQGPSGYSNLVMLGKKRVGILFEAGLKDLAEGIAFESYALDEINQRVEVPEEKKK